MCKNTLQQPDTDTEDLVEAAIENVEEYLYSSHFTNCISVYLEFLPKQTNSKIILPFLTKSGIVRSFNVRLEVVASLLCYVL